MHPRLKVVLTRGLVAEKSNIPGDYAEAKWHSAQKVFDPETP